MTKHRTTGIQVETLPLLRLVHDGLELSLATKDEDLADAVDSLYSALSLGMKYPSQYLPVETRLFIRYIQEKLLEHTERSK